MSDWPANPVASKPFGYLLLAGHSGIADFNGVTQPDYGPAHKIDQMLQPAMFRSLAQGGCVFSYSERGNGTNGDGGWGRFASELDRQDAIAGYTQGVLSGAGNTAGATSILLTVAQGGPLEYLVVGTGAVTEVIQVSGAYAGGSTTIPLQPGTTLANSHAAGEPVYHALKNFGYVGRDSVVVIDAGGNDVPVLGPGAAPVTLQNTWQSGTFGTTPGASRGLTPFMHALRFAVCVARCTVIYGDTHVNVVYGANWNNFNIATTNSWPAQYAMGTPNNQNYHYTTTAGSTITFSTEPSYNGQPIDIFTFCYHDGGGAIWDYSVAGATTVGLTSHAAGSVWDDRSVNAVSMNDGVGLGTGTTTGSAKRITGLNPGVNTVTLKASTLNTYGIFLGWGIEATIPPLVMLMQQFRLGGYGTGYGYGLWSSQPYVRRTPATTQTATVAANAGHLAGTVTLGTAVTVGTTATTNAAVYPNDTITIDPGTANEETRRIVGVDSTTTLHVDSDFLIAHSAKPCVIGYQDADFVGGGYANSTDTQGALSVPGLNGAIAAVAGEFDAFVQVFNADAAVNPPGPGASPPANNLNLANDGVHWSDQGGGVGASALITRIFNLSRPTLKDIGTYCVPNKRSYVFTYGEQNPAASAATGGASQFVGNWQNFYPMSTGSVVKTGFYKDGRTRMVTLAGAITYWGTLREDQLPSAALVIPVGYRPRGLTPISAWSSLGPAVMEANNDGYVYVTAGFYTQATPPASGGAYLEFYATWLPES